MPEITETTKIRRPRCSKVLDDCHKHNASISDPNQKLNCRIEVSRCKDLDAQVVLSNQLKQFPIKKSIGNITFMNEEKQDPKDITNLFLMDGAHVAAFFSNRLLKRSDFHFPVNKYVPAKITRVNCSPTVTYEIATKDNSETSFDYGTEYLDHFKKLFAKLGEKKLRLFIEPKGNGPLLVKGSKNSFILAPRVEEDDNVPYTPEQKAEMEKRTPYFSYGRFKRIGENNKIHSSDKICEILLNEKRLETDEPKPECNKKWNECLEHNKTVTNPEDKKDCRKETHECKDYEELFKLRRILNKIKEPPEPIKEEPFENAVNSNKYPHVIAYFSNRQFKHPKFLNGTVYNQISEQTQGKITQVGCSRFEEPRFKIESKDASYEIRTSLLDWVLNKFKHKLIGEKSPAIHVSKDKPIIVFGKRFSAVLAPHSPPDDNEPGNTIYFDYSTFRQKKKQMKQSKDVKVCDQLLDDIPKVSTPASTPTQAQ